LQQALASVNKEKSLEVKIAESQCKNLMSPQLNTNRAVRMETNSSSQVEEDVEFFAPRSTPHSPEASSTSSSDDFNGTSCEDYSSSDSSTSSGDCERDVASFLRD
jgi:hypothetical protein